MSLAVASGRHRPKKTAYVLGEGQQAADQKTQANLSGNGLDAATAECRLLAVLQARFARFEAILFPLTDDQLLLSQAGGLTCTVPDVRAARELLKQWEAT